MSGKDMDAIHTFDKAWMVAFQEDALLQILPYTLAAPIYARKFADAGIKSQDVGSYADISKIPFTCKADIHATTVFERTPLQQKDIYAIYSSNGTSGKPTLYAWSHDDVQVQREMSHRILSKIGVDETDLGLILAPLSLPVMGHCMIRQYESVGAGFVPLGPVDPATIISFLRQMPITSVATLPILASRLWEFMKVKLSLGADDVSHIRSFLLGGDFLSDARRSRLETCWKANCFDLYGISELFGPISGECRLKNGLHFGADKVLIEVLDPFTAQPVSAGQKGVAVLSSLWRKGFPLLRYWTDDFISLSWEPCACGNPAPRIWYYGRKIDCAHLHGRFIFPKDVENCLLRFPVSDEYHLDYHDGRKPYIQVHVEPIPGMALPKPEIKDAVADLFDMPVRIYPHTPGSLPRNQIKPKRLINFPLP